MPRWKAARPARGAAVPPATISPSSTPGSICSGAGDDGGFFQPFAPNFRNVLAILDGSDPKLRDQVIVVGAHYDHVGYGGRGLSLGPYGYVHPGADDNASGTVGRAGIGQGVYDPLRRRPSVRSSSPAWDAEEKGLLGSKHWVAHPTVPLDRVVAGAEPGHDRPAPRRAPLIVSARGAATAGGGC